MHPTLLLILPLLGQLPAGQDVQTGYLVPPALFGSAIAGAPVAHAASLDDQQLPPNSKTNPKRPVRKLFTDIGKDFYHFPSERTAFWLGAGGGLAGALHPFDDNIVAHYDDKTPSAFWKPGKVIGYGWFQFGAAAGTWIWGRAKSQPRVVHLGVDLLQVQVLAQGLTYATKYAVRRDRPDGTSGYSFPSGHATVTFASATVLQQHLGWKAAVPTYAVATYVAASRLAENRHYLSDVVFGAALGIASGRTVVRHGRTTWAMVPTASKEKVALMFVKVPQASGQH